MSSHMKIRKDDMVLVIGGDAIDGACTGDSADACHSPSVAAPNAAWDRREEPLTC